MDNNEKKIKILVVDDEQDIRKLLRIYLTKQNYQVYEAENGLKAIEIMQRHSDMDLIVMDIMMPEMSGLDACKAIREFSSVPVLFLTAKTQEPDKQEAYETGGDDFLSKPFSQSEFIRKINTLIRRYNVYKGKEETDDRILSFRNIQIDVYKRAVTKDGENVRLTDKEYALLHFLMENKGRPWGLEELYENIWQEKYLPTSSNTVMVHVLRLRQKIEENPASPEIIRTIYGKGYQID